jgi:DNA-binding beta-propeller fold protein YncE
MGEHSMRYGRVAFCLLLTFSLVQPGFADPVWPTPPARGRISFLSSFTGPDALGLKQGGLGATLRRLLYGREDLAMVRPYGVFASGSKIYVADPGQRVVHVFDRGSNRYDRLLAPDTVSFLSPMVVAVDPQGSILVSDSQRGTVLVFDSNLRFLTTFGSEEGLERPTGLVCAAERVYVVDTAGHRVLVYRRDGRANHYLFAFGSRGTVEGMFNFPVDIAVSNKGQVYVNDSMNFRIQVFDADGRFLRVIGSSGDSTGHFQRSKGIALDSDGNLYVADALADTVQIFDRDGRFLLNFGAAGKADGEFWIPAGIAVDEQDRIYVADSYNARVQIFQYEKEVIDEQ